MLDINTSVFVPQIHAFKNPGGGYCGGSLNFLQNAGGSILFVQNLKVGTLFWGSLHFY